MTYKNGIKEYALSGAIFGALIGILFGVRYLDLLIGVICGVLSGLLFAVLIFAFIKYQEKKFDKKRIEIAKERVIICDGVATINGNGGWMFFTENGLEFYPHKINLSTKEIVISRDTIKKVITYKNKLIINPGENPVTVIVSHSKEWKAQIEKVISDRSEQ